MRRVQVVKLVTAAAVEVVVTVLALMVMMMLVALVSVLVVMLVVILMVLAATAAATMAAVILSASAENCLPTTRPRPPGEGATVRRSFSRTAAPLSPRLPACRRDGCPCPRRCRRHHRLLSPLRRAVSARTSSALPPAGWTSEGVGILTSSFTTPSAPRRMPPGAKNTQRHHRGSLGAPTVHMTRRQTHQLCVNLSLACHPFPRTIGPTGGGQ